LTSQQRSNGLRAREQILVHRLIYAPLATELTCDRCSFAIKMRSFESSPGDARALPKGKRRRRESDSTPPRTRLAHEALSQLKGDPHQDEVSFYNGCPSLYQAFRPIRPTLPLCTVQNSRTDFAPGVCASRVPMKISHSRIRMKWSAPGLNQMHSISTSDFPLFSVLDRLSPQFQSSIAYSLSPLLSPLIAAFPDLKRSP
jgi:hypothetical protein